MADLEAHFYGHEQDYEALLHEMRDLHAQVIEKKKAAQLMLLEHKPVITVTRQHGLRSIKTSSLAIKNAGIDLFEADRGGDASFHGPGQLVGYPLLPLEKSPDARYFDLERFIRSLENALFHAVKSFGLKNARLLPGFSGIWIKCGRGRALNLKKVMAIGVGVKNGVSKHGFALNIDLDLSRYQEHIVPCGLKDYGVIDLREAFFLECLPMPDYFAIVTRVAQCLADNFGLTLRWRSQEAFR
jgi:lipoyl(octanoyl) transferase